MNSITRFRSIFRTTVFIHLYQGHRQCSSGGLDMLQPFKEMNNDSKAITD